MKPSGTVYEREEVLVTKIGQPQRRRMQDVEDIEENPPQPNEKRLTAGSPTLNRYLNGKAPVAAPFHL